MGDVCPAAATSRSSRSGERCLIGANAGDRHFSLGDDCVVEAGCYVTAGAKLVQLADGRTVKAR